MSTTSTKCRSGPDPRGQRSCPELGGGNQPPAAARGDPGHERVGQFRDRGVRGDLSSRSREHGTPVAQHALELLGVGRDGQGVIVGDHFGRMRSTRLASSVHIPSC